MKLTVIDGQELFLPSDEELNSKIDEEYFRGWRNYDFAGLSAWIDEHKQYKGVEIAFLGPKGRCSPICFVEVSGAKYRVHIENLICEFCDKRSGISGTPGVWDLYYGCDDPDAIMEKAMSLPVKSCVQCGKKQRRRHTVWFEHEQHS